MPVARDLTCVCQFPIAVQTLFAYASFAFLSLLPPQPAAINDSADARNARTARDRVLLCIVPPLAGIPHCSTPPTSTGTCETAPSKAIESTRHRRVIVQIGRNHPPHRSHGDPFGRALRRFGRRDLRRRRNGAGLAHHVLGVIVRTELGLLVLLREEAEDERHPDQDGDHRRQISPLVP